MRLGLTYMRRRRGTRAPCHRIASNVTPTAPSALYATRGGGPGGLTIIAILDLLGGAAQCMVAAGPMHGIQLPATDACKCMALYGGLCMHALCILLHAPLYHGHICEVPERFRCAYYPALRPGTESHAESSFSELLLILSQQKIFHNFMHMRAKTICGF